MFAHPTHGRYLRVFKGRSNFMGWRFKWLFLLAKPDGFDHVSSYRFARPRAMVSTSGSSGMIGWNSYHFKIVNHKGHEGSLRKPLVRLGSFDSYFFRNVPFSSSLERLLQFLLRVHDDGTVPRHGLFQRLS